MSIIANGQAQMGLANNERAAQDLKAKTRDIDSLRESLLPQVDKDKKLRKACEGFETIFVKKMWEEMQNTVQQSDFLKGRDEKHWRSMYNQEIAEIMTSAGGIGLADMMYKQLSGDLANASRATIATSFSAPTTGFEIKPVPLINLSDTGQVKSLNSRMDINEKVLAGIELDSKTAVAIQNNKSMYSGEANQPKTPNIEQINNRSIQNAHDAIAKMGEKHINTGNANIIQDVLEQLKSQKTENANKGVDAKETRDKALTAVQLKAASPEQGITTNSVYVANTDNMQQNYILQQSPNAQPLRNNVYVEPIIHKVSGGGLLPPSSPYIAEATRKRLPKQSSIHQAQVNGSPGISPSQYVNNSPFVVKAPAVKNTEQDNTKISRQVQNIVQPQGQNYIPANIQANHLRQMQQSLLEQNLTILPSERILGSI